MKLAKRALGVLLLVAVPMLAWAGLTQAQRFSNSIDEGEVVNSSLYSTGRNVRKTNRIVTSRPLNRPIAGRSRRTRRM